MTNKKIVIIDKEYPATSELYRMMGTIDSKPELIDRVGQIFRDNVADFIGEYEDFIGDGEKSILKMNPVMAMAILEKFKLYTGALIAMGKVLTQVVEKHEYMKLAGSKVPDKTGKEKALSQADRKIIADSAAAAYKGMVSGLENIVYSINDKYFQIKNARRAYD